MSSYKNTIFALVRKAYKMHDSKINNCKTLKINIAAIIKDPEMLRFVPDHLKTKRISKNAVKNMLFTIKYVPDQYKTTKMCEIVFIENG